MGLSTLILIFLAETAVLELLALPRKLYFESYLLRDQAITLNFQYLLTHGYRTNTDFGYQYGLLGFLPGRFWFSIFPPTNLSIQPLFVAMNALVAIGVARFAHYAKLGGVGVICLLVTLPIAIQPENTYFLESVFLTNALAEHARGKRENALALATASCFAKPVMGYFYGFLLVLLIGVELWRTGNLKVKGAAVAFAPAGLTATGLALFLSVNFGIHALTSTIFPLRGAETYRMLHWGFFTGNSRFFWYFPGVRIGYYFGTPTAFWFAGSLWLIVSGSVALARSFEQSGKHLSYQSRLNYEIVCSCAALHVLFVTLF